MEVAFITICTVMTGLLIWGLGWYVLLAGSVAAVFMHTLFRMTRPR